ncbi:porin [Methylococcus capsulatus]|uniref:porin n=2 Tax=Methylococcus capsulatus TaxID=414 RepID=UPI00030C4129|nr:porin [Methylococcus capsulatus]
MFMALARLVRFAWAYALLTGLFSTGFQASATDTTSGLLDFLGAGIDQRTGFQRLGIRLGGWVNASVTYNASRPADNFNGPVSFNDRAGEPQMNQFYLYLERAIAVGPNEWDVGGRFDFMYGTDTIFTQAYGIPYVDPRTGRPLNRGHWDLHLSSWSDRFYGIALPQAYAEFNLPMGNGIVVKAGHFYTPLGYEMVTAPDNFFITRPYTFQFNPFTHTGILSGYAIDANWAVSAGAVTGSATGGGDGTWDEQLGNWDFLGGGVWTSDDKSDSLSLTAMAGGRSERFGDLWAIYSLVGKTSFLDDRLHYVIEHTHGFADQVQTANYTRNGGKLENAQWYGIAQWLTYALEEHWSVGLRAEWWRDNNGFRVSGPPRCSGSMNVNGAGEARPYACNPDFSTVYPFQGSGYYALTVGLNWKPLNWVILRPNARYDWSDAIKIFDAGKRSDQFLFSADVTVTF